MAARQTEAVFPSSSLSYAVIMNISSMFSHTHDSHTLAKDEVLQQSPGQPLGVEPLSFLPLQGSRTPMSEGLGCG